MPRYNVDVKAFISVAVEAPDEASARAAADLFVENLSPTGSYIRGYSDQLKEFGEAALVLDSTGTFDVDGESEVEEEK
ncbi:hypothetical protein SAMN03159338_1529 [Sphingomonas sp. NFR04]|uniref:hypothetical protein n=1 Tax=Sphingomonas sp. NFR04 TaxID=1566283 RepID=UPI0008F17B3B|nr:hypothetical protein [Sphingomonas sp. NFR04]SFJ48645.1 hypothetical protein SAMN03159338_1529 [Sphingomonas sp. NFR04]